MKEEDDPEVEKTKEKLNVTTKENYTYLSNHQQGSLPKPYDNSMEISRMLKTMMLNFVHALKLAIHPCNEIDSLRSQHHGHLKKQERKTQVVNEKLLK